MPPIPVFHPLPPHPCCAPHALLLASRPSPCPAPRARLRPQHVSELGLDIDSRAPGSKLALLLLHFPRLRLMWSRR